MFEITIRSSSARLTVASQGIPNAVENSWPVDQQRQLPSLSILPNYFRSKFRTSFVAKPLHNLFSVTITCCYFFGSSCCFFPLLLLTITRKEDFFNVTLLWDSDVLNDDRKKSTKLDSGISWNSSHCVRFMRVMVKNSR